MNRIIKFRGVDIETRKHIIYGFGYADLNGKKYIFDAEFGMAYHVAPDSVAQLIAVDKKKGKEVYEGDWIVSRFGSQCLASFRHYAGICDGTYIFVRSRICGVDSYDD